MPTLIHERVRQAQNGQNPKVITRLPSGWVVMGDVQSVEGYCLLLPDPVVKDLNSLDEKGRIAYTLDMIRVGDAILEVTGAYRINYEIWGNQDPALHVHITPRYQTEPDDKRVRPVMVAYDPAKARKFDAATDRAFMDKMRQALARHSIL